MARFSSRDPLAVLERKYGVYGAERDEEYVEGGFGLSLPHIMEQVFYENSFRLYVLAGRQGSGKSSYALRSIALLLHGLGVFPEDMGEEEMLTMVLYNYTTFMATEDEKRIAVEYFTARFGDKVGSLISMLPSLEGLVERTSWRHPLPAVLVDEAGITMGAYEFFMDKYYTQKVITMVQTLRSRVKNVVLTTPDPRNIMRNVRSSLDRVLVLVERTPTPWVAKVKGYIYRATPVEGNVVPRLLFEDDYYFRLPDGFYKRYMTIRDFFVTYAAERMKFRHKIRKASRGEL